MSNSLNKLMEDNQILKVVTVNSDSISNVEAYKKLKTQAWISGGVIANEIDENGNIVLQLVFRGVRDCDIENFNSKDVATYQYERRGMSSFIIDGFVQAELIINPSYYEDDRFEKLLSRGEVNMYCEMIDCTRDKIVAVRNITIGGKCLDYLKQGLMMNAQHSREEYLQWVVNVLYSNGFKKNIKLSERLGKCRDSKEYVTVLV